MAVPHETRTAWWRGPVIYQVYPRSFADGDGDGIGDLLGLRDRLPYLRDLGVDAIWVNPWYLSPQADGGYDVADYRAIDPVLGTLTEAQQLIDDVHAVGLRIVLDIVPNHVSSQHAWFRAALAAGPDSPERDLFHFRPGRGVSGDLPPNDWRSAFGGPAWTRVTTPAGAPEQWYLRLFSAGQPDLNWGHPAVRAEHLDVLRYWFDRGVDGFRVDMAHALVKHDDLPDLGEQASDDVLAPPTDASHPFLDRDEVHDVYRSWRAVADGYRPPRWFLAEVWSDAGRPDRFDNYLRSDELHSAFQFDYLGSPWRADWLRRAIDRSLATTRNVGSTPTWALSNHDLVRHPSRFGRPQPDHPVWSMLDLLAGPLDPALGLRRARAAALLTLALPGPAVLYQGEELGLLEVEDVATDLRRDGVWASAQGRARSRDGARVPLPWSGTRSPYGFSSGDRSPWLPQPADWAGSTVAAQSGRPGSMLELHRAALRLRRELALDVEHAFRWLDPAPEVLAFRRADRMTCLVNLGPGPVPLPGHTEILLASGEIGPRGLPPDTAAWLR